jgi:hypothetical protein
MAKFNIGGFQKAYIKAGKELRKSNFEITAELGIIGVMDPAFAGRRQGENGEYIMLKNTDGDLMFVSLAKGTPAKANKFAIKELQVTEDFEIDGKTIAAGTKSFKAYAVVEEGEE